MTSKNKEIDFYPELCSKLRLYLEEYLPSNCKIAFSENKTLPNMIEEIEEKLGARAELSSDYIPCLNLDILCGILIPSRKVALLLFEVKYDKNLTLAHFSQLIGYLQVAKNISAGVLLLVSKKISSNTLSNNFSDILNTNNLPLEWQLTVKQLREEPYDFRVGIASYVTRNGIDWVSSQKVNGISNFNELVKYLLVHS